MSSENDGRLKQWIDCFEILFNTNARKIYADFYKLRFATPYHCGSYSFHALISYIFQSLELGYSPKQDKFIWSFKTRISGLNVAVITASKIYIGPSLIQKGTSLLHGIIEVL